jgi:general secretion pathway protein C
VGDWKASTALVPVTSSPATLLTSFDPFFRLSGQSSAPVAVTSLNLTLYGVREDRASGRGAAIISTPDGQQRSFAVGEEIVPGVTLTAVGFDGVTISRGGTLEQLYLDQSRGVPGAPGVAPPPLPQPGVQSQPSGAPPAGLVFGGQPPVPSPNSVTSEIQFQPRISGGAVNGVAVQPIGNGEAFRAAGLQPGDVIVSVNGQRVTSAEQARSLATQLEGTGATLQVDRGGRTIPLRVRGGQ